MPLTSLGVGSVNVMWDASTNGPVAGYNVYYGTASKTYGSQLNVGANVSAALSNLADGKTYYIAVTAYDAVGNESDFSTEVSYTVPGIPNSPPTISTIANQTITAGQSTSAIAFTIDDPDTGPTGLTLDMVSSNTGLVPKANIVFGGSGANRTVTVTPVAGQTGTTQITLYVSDGTFSTQTSFNVTVQAQQGQNHAPTISAIADQSITAGQSTGAISFTVNDADTGAAGLSVSASSSNPTLVPNANIVLSGSGANRTVTVTPAAGKTGTAQITLTVSDGSLTAQTSFNVTVQAQQSQNHAPTISAVADQSITAGQSTGAITFTVNDADTGAASVTVSASSSNPTLVPNANVVLGGSGANRTVTVTPAAGKTGTAQITLTVSDGSLTAQTSFGVTVQAQQSINHAPTISGIANQNIATSQPTGAIPFTVNDVDTGAAGLSVSAVSSNPTLIPNANIVLGGSGANRTVTVTSAAGQTGTAQITLTVSDGSLSAQTSFIVTVQTQPAMAKTTLPKTSTYNGLFYEQDAVRLQSAGSIKVTVSSKGKYSGQLQMAAGKYSFSGTFGTFCTGTNVIVRKGGTPLHISFSLQPGAAAGQLQGNLSDGTWTAQLNGGQAVYNTKTHPAPFAGTYTLTVPGGDNSSGVSLGNSFGSLTVDGNGNVKLAGSLADGTKVSQASGLTVDGTWPLFVPLYAGQGMLMGWVSFTNRVQDDLNGPVNWIKTANPVSKYYSGGLAIQAGAIGSKFVSTGSKLTFGEAKLELGDADNQLIMSLKLSTKNGVFTGLMFNPTTGKGMPFQGALLQKVSTGYGFLLQTGQSASVVLTQ